MFELEGRRGGSQFCHEYVPGGNGNVIKSSASGRAHSHSHSATALM
jgi:hypothetical protein